MTSVKSSSLAPAGVPIGSAVMFEAQQPDDVTIYGRRYLKSGFIETDSSLFDTSIFTTKQPAGGATRDPQFSGSTPESVVYGGGLFVVVGGGGKISTSPDGVTWTARTSGTTQKLDSIIYGGGLFVAVGGNGVLLTSSDGINWTVRTSSFGGSQIYDVAYDGVGTYLAVGVSDKVATSPDGVTWTQRTTVAAGGNWTGVTFGNGVFAICNSNNTANRFQTSSDGITWTSRSSSELFEHIEYGNGYFIATYAGGGMYRSADATSGAWTSFSPATVAYFPSAIKFTDGVGFVYSTSGSGIVGYSFDGENWLSTTEPASISNGAAVFSSSKLVTVGGSGLASDMDLQQYAGSLTAYSADGQNQYIRIS